MLRIQAKTVVDNAGIMHLRARGAGKITLSDEIDHRYAARHVKDKSNWTKNCFDFATEVLAKTTRIFNADYTYLILFPIIFKYQDNICVFLFKATCFEYVLKKQSTTKAVKWCEFAAVTNPRTG